MPLRDVARQLLTKLMRDDPLEGIERSSPGKTKGWKAQRRHRRGGMPEVLLAPRRWRRRAASLRGADTQHPLVALAPTQLRAALLHRVVLRQPAQGAVLELATRLAREGPACGQSLAARAAARERGLEACLNVMMSRSTSRESTASRRRSSSMPATTSSSTVGPSPAIVPGRLAVLAGSPGRGLIDRDRRAGCRPPRRSAGQRTRRSPPPSAGARAGPASALGVRIARPRHDVDR